jgi:hypothetical protein
MYEAVHTGMTAGPNLAVGKKLFNESQLYIILHPFYIQHCVRKTWWGGAPTSWLIGLPVINLAPTGYISYNAASLAI